MVFFHGGSGSLPGSWEPTGSGTSFEVGELHRTLAPYQDRMVLFENLDMVSVRRDPTGARNAHPTARPTA